ncbi:MAG: 2-amino-4-hydroxy-6-hydroxymethyldihydropteridine diphosphokinase [Taibaiella sp.]|nr:2-amino-4-hydroxy-6-hydroxymethyldihydropteridine diphosphokinase [Taibaiella sp.]
MTDVYLLLGSNEGDREQWLLQAVQQLNVLGAISSQSALYQTAAWGIEDQPAFLNMALCLQTELHPLELLQEIHHIEQNLGRQRTLKWGQRTLDIDILFYGDAVIDLPELKVPHPYLQERRFALVPLNEITPDFLHPGLNKTVSQLLDECPDKLEVLKY